MIYRVLMTVDRYYSTNSTHSRVCARVWECDVYNTDSMNTTESTQLQKHIYAYMITESKSHKHNHINTITITSHITTHHHNSTSSQSQHHNITALCNYMNTIIIIQYVSSSYSPGEYNNTIMIITITTSHIVQLFHTVHNHNHNHNFMITITSTPTQPYHQKNHGHKHFNTIT